MGDKTEARKAAGECGVPVIPGTKGSITNAQEALDFARSVGLPVMLKAAYGGGGRGMRVVRAGQFFLQVLLMKGLDTTTLLTSSKCMHGMLSQEVDFKGDQWG